MTYAQIVFPIPFDKTFDYRIPDNLKDKVKIGQAVVVPFGNSIQTGYCVALADKTDIPSDKIKFLSGVIEDIPPISEPILKLARCIADYYLCSWGEALEATLPAGVRKESGVRQGIFVALDMPQDKIIPEIDRLKRLPKAQKQAHILNLLISSGGELSFQEIQKKLGISISPINSLKRAKLVRLEKRDILFDSYLSGSVTKEQPFPPTPAQADAISKIKDSLAKNKSDTFLLHGITGSGKTEVYLQVIAEAIKNNKQAIVLVPEISLTPQAVSRFRRRFDRIAVLHSYMTEGQRAKQWHNIRNGEIDVVIGARSAIFAPTKNLGIIVIDEEHETSFKQESTPRYNTRDVAVKRAEIERATVILGSATPSLEAYYFAQTGSFCYLEIPERIENRPLPAVEIVDMTQQKGEKDNTLVISKPLELAIKESLKEKEQVILFLNRRGYITLVTCPKCKHIVRCKHCRTALTYHKKINRMICHHCNTETDLPEICPECAYPNLKKLGSGTERVEEYINKIFNPKETKSVSRINRVDSDIMRLRQSGKEALDALWKGETDILVGTQMVAKGLDFPNVTLVGIISADTALYLKDFRSAERTFQLITQVAGRTGRGAKGGRVIVQTVNPQHYSIIHASRHDYRSFAAEELKYRKAFLYPPYSHLLRILMEGKDEAKTEVYGKQLAGKIKEFIGDDKDIEILGPAPCPWERIKNHYRWQIVIKSKTADFIHKLYHVYRKDFNSTSKSIRLTLDIDPLNLL
ncbi:MAG: primosomal protein N' [Planctomycetes bacterium]|nr:primosomal protein N' [Planctomycetota bacterium]